jgi:hypothetical protein
MQMPAAGAAHGFRRRRPVLSFPRSAWERRGSPRSASKGRRASGQCVPTQSVGTSDTDDTALLAIADEIDGLLSGANKRK